MQTLVNAFKSASHCLRCLLIVKNAPLRWKPGKLILIMSLRDSLESSCQPVKCSWAKVILTWNRHQTLTAKSKLRCLSSLPCSHGVYSTASKIVERQLCSLRPWRNASTRSATEWTSQDSSQYALIASEIGRRSYEATLILKFKQSFWSFQEPKEKRLCTMTWNVYYLRIYQFPVKLS